MYAGLQIELEEEADNLIFENEHQLGKKPMEIDVLIIKKEKEKKIHKNICRIFRKYNIVEYKSPTDYLSIDDFYKVYGYTCFYKSDTGTTDSVKIKELTLYESVMDMVVRANGKKFEEERDMCDALKEIMADEFDKRERNGEQRVNNLISKLLELGRNDDISKAVKNPEYQKQLFEEFGL